MNKNTLEHFLNNYEYSYKYSVTDSVFADHNPYKRQQGFKYGRNTKPYRFKSPERRHNETCNNRFKNL